MRLNRVNWLRLYAVAALALLCCGVFLFVCVAAGASPAAPVPTVPQSVCTAFASNAEAPLGVSVRAAAAACPSVSV